MSGSVNGLVKPPRETATLPRIHHQWRGYMAANLNGRNPLTFHGLSLEPQPSLVLD
jgi:hypothetical protein